jgi:hypothetical protein
MKFLKTCINARNVAVVVVVVVVVVVAAAVIILILGVCILLHV